MTPSTSREITKPLLTVRPPDLGYVPQFVTPEAESRVIQALDEYRACSAREWEAVRFRGRLARRLSLSFGGRYRPTGRSVEPAPELPAWLTELRDRAVHAACNALGSELVLAGRAVEEFSQVIVWKYPAGAGLGWHTDASIFGPTILSLSLQSSARIELRQLDAAFRMTLAPGSLLVLAGEARAAWQHRVTRVKEERVSFTFRTVSGI